MNSRASFVFPSSDEKIPMARAIQSLSLASATSHDIETTISEKNCTSYSSYHRSRGRKRQESKALSGSGDGPLFRSPMMIEVSNNNNSARREGLFRRPKVPFIKNPNTPIVFPKEEPMAGVEITPTELAMMKPFPSSSKSLTRLAANHKGQNTYPLIYLSQSGCICIVLADDLVIETSFDCSIRIVRHGKFAVFMDGRGLASSIVHPAARILHSNKSVCGRFKAFNEKLVIVGHSGVLFTMDHLREAYMVSSGIKGTSAISVQQLHFPKLDSDYTLLQFYKGTQTGETYISLCQDIVNQASYDRRSDGTLLMQINGMIIRHSSSGDIVVDARPRQIFCSAEGAVQMRSSHISLSVQQSDSTSIKYGLKRVHISCSGMVLSDGSSCTSMDQFGRIISST